MSAGNSGLIVAAITVLKLNDKLVPINNNVTIMEDIQFLLDL